MVTPIFLAAEHQRRHARAPARNSDPRRRHRRSGRSDLCVFAIGAPGLKQGGGIVKRFAAPLVSVDETDEQRGAADARLELFEDLEILRNELRFEDEVLRRITGNGELRRQDQFRSGGRQPLVGAGDFLKIAAQIPDGGIDLSETDLHAVPRKLCAARRSAIPFEPGYGLAFSVTAGEVCL